ncbi:distal long tail fiber assembly catalyst [Salmonella phage 19]|nr:distal long tail fiber assembly catalyst [Salmonella phage 19]
MVERLKTAPWKGVGPLTGVRRFESYFHRQFWKINPNQVRDLFAKETVAPERGVSVQI